MVRLRGLPFQASEDDVRQFFTGFACLNVHLCKRNGRATGEAYAQFESEEIAAAALEAKNKQNMGHRYIEIFEALESDMAHLKALGVSGKVKGYVVRMRGLPYTAAVDDVVQFFEGIGISRGAEGVVFTCTRDGRPTGEAYVELPTEEAQKEALKRHKNSIGDRYIELFKVNKVDMVQAMQQNSYNMMQAERKRNKAGNGSGSTASFTGSAGAAGGRGGQPPPPVPTSGPASQVDGTTLKLRGLPYSAGVDEITDFFQGFSLASGGVQLLTQVDQGGNNVGTGVAYVQFDNSDEASRAKDARNHAKLGSRYIECSTHAQEPPPQTRSYRAAATAGSEQQSRENAVDVQGVVGAQAVDQGAAPIGNQVAPYHAMLSGEMVANAALDPADPSQLLSQQEYQQQQQMMMQQQMLMQQQHYMMQQQQMRFDPSNWGGMQGQGNVQSGGWYKGYGDPGMAQPGNNLGMGMSMNNSMQPFPGTAYGNYSGMHGGSTGQQGEEGAGYLDMGHYGSDGYPMGQSYPLGGWGMGSMLDESTPAWIPSTSTTELS